MMVRLLVVRNEADLEETIIKANELLAFEGRRSAWSDHDAILGIWISPNLDRSLQCSCQRVSGPHQNARQADDKAEDLPLSVCRSTSLSGIWTLSCFDGPALLGIDGTPDRRQVILHHISRSVSRADAVPQPNSFLPVFNSELPEEALQRELNKLQREHPHLVHTRTLCYDKAVGIKPR